MDADKITTSFKTQLTKYAKSILLIVLIIILTCTLAFRWIQVQQANKQIKEQFNWLLDIMAPYQQSQAQIALTDLKQAIIRNEVNVAEWHQIGYMIAEIKHDGQLTDAELDSLISVIESTSND